MPDLERYLDWELGLFQAARSLWRRVVPERAPETRPGVLDPEPLLHRLEVFAGVLAGSPVKLGLADGLGGVRGDVLLLPRAFEGGADPEASLRALLVRVAVDATTWARGDLAPGEGPARDAASREAARTSVAELCATWPRFAGQWAEVTRELGDAPLDAPGCPLYGRLLRLETAADGQGDPQEPPPRPTTEAAARVPEDVKVVDLAQKQGVDLPIHVFEKVETIEEHQGPLRHLDGDDELSEHLDALQEVDLSNLVRGGPEAHSMLRADVAIEAEIPDVATVGADEPYVAYDEWDHRAGAYRKDWCRVYPTAVRAQAPAWARERREALRPVVDEVHRRLLAVRAARAARPRQLEGDDLDLDALVSARGDQRAGRTPDPRFFVERRRSARSLAITVLLDLSLSSDSWVEGRRVLDVARDAVLVLGDVAERLGDTMEVLAFASMTRNRIRVFDVRRRGEPWAVGAARLGALGPQGYTRIGPALRHATARLADAPATQRALILVSDGRPTDFDRYEGRYGVADVRRALVEARNEGVHVHALTVDASARGHVASMLGPGSWDLLPEPAALPGALARLLARLA